MNSNILFFSRNYCDNATVTPDASPPAANPVSNLKTEPPRDTWRSPNLTNTGLKFDMGADVPLINAICLVRHNASADGTWNLYGNATDVFPANKSSATFKLLNQDFYPSIFGAGEYYAGFGGAGGTLDADNLPLYHQTVFATFDQQELRYWYIEFSDAANPDGYIELGRLFIGQYFQPVYNFGWGHSLEFVDPSIQVRTKGGGVLTDIQTPYRRKRVSLPYLQNSEKYWDVYNLLKTVGKRGNLVISFFPDAGDTGNRFETIYGKLVEFSGVQGNRLDTNEFSFTFEELV